MPWIDRETGLVIRDPDSHNMEDLAYKPSVYEYSELPTYVELYQTILDGSFTYDPEIDTDLNMFWQAPIKLCNIATTTNFINMQLHEYGYKEEIEKYISDELNLKISLHGAICTTEDDIAEYEENVVYCTNPNPDKRAVSLIPQDYVTKVKRVLSPTKATRVEYHAGFNNPGDDTQENRDNVGKYIKAYIKECMFKGIAEYFEKL